MRFDHSIVVDTPYELSYAYLESKMFQAFLGVRLASTYMFGLSGLSAESAGHSIRRWWLLSDLQWELNNLAKQNVR